MQTSEKPFKQGIVLGDITVRSPSDITVEQLLDAIPEPASHVHGSSSSIFRKALVSQGGTVQRSKARVASPGRRVQSDDGHKRHEMTARPARKRDKEIAEGSPVGLLKEPTANSMHESVGSSSGKSSLIGPTLKDLCEEDKKKVASLIKQLVKAGSERERALLQIEEQKSAFNERINKLRAQNQQIINETVNLRSKFAQSLQLLRTYQQKLQVIQAEQSRSRQDEGRFAQLQTEVARLQQLMEKEQRNNDELGHSLNQYAAAAAAASSTLLPASAVIDASLPEQQSGSTFDAIVQQEAYSPVRVQLFPTSMPVPQFEVTPSTLTVIPLNTAIRSPQGGEPVSSPLFSQSSFFSFEPSSPVTPLPPDRPSHIHTSSSFVSPVKTASPQTLHTSQQPPPLAVMSSMPDHHVAALQLSLAVQSESPSPNNLHLAQAFVSGEHAPFDLKVPEYLAPTRDNPSMPEISLSLNTSSPLLNPVNLASAAYRLAATDVSAPVPALPVPTDTSVQKSARERVMPGPLLSKDLTVASSPSPLLDPAWSTRPSSYAVEAQTHQSPREASYMRRLSRMDPEKRAFMERILSIRDSPSRPSLKPAPIHTNPSTIGAVQMENTQTSGSDNGQDQGTRNDAKHVQADQFGPSAPNISISTGDCEMLPSRYNSNLLTGEIPDQINDVIPRTRISPRRTGRSLKPAAVPSNVSSADFHDEQHRGGADSKALGSREFTEVRRVVNRKQDMTADPKRCRRRTQAAAGAGAEPSGPSKSSASEHLDGSLTPWSGPSSPSSDEAAFGCDTRPSQDTAQTDSSPKKHPPCHAQHLLISNSQSVQIQPRAESTIRTLNSSGQGQSPVGGASLRTAAAQTKVNSSDRTVRVRHKVQKHRLGLGESRRAVGNTGLKTDPSRGETPRREELLDRQTLVAVLEAERLLLEEEREKLAKASMQEESESSSDGNSETNEGDSDSVASSFSWGDREAHQKQSFSKGLSHTHAGSHRSRQNRSDHSSDDQEGTRQRTKIEKPSADLSRKPFTGAVKSRTSPSVHHTRQSQLEIESEAVWAAVSTTRSQAHRSDTSSNEEYYGESLFELVEAMERKHE